MIRYCTNSDKKQVIELWSCVFGDSISDIEEFLSVVPLENCLGYFLEDKLVSQLFLVDSIIYISEVSYTGKYIYAACTSKEHRSKGYMGELLKYACVTNPPKGVDFLTLVPASESLFDYYSRFGFYKLFFASRVSTKTDYNLSDYNHMSFSAAVKNYALSIASEDSLKLVPVDLDCCGDKLCNGMAFNLTARAKQCSKLPVFFNLTMG